MLYRFFMILVAFCISEMAVAYEYSQPQQVVTSEVFYDYGQETQKNAVEENRTYQPRYMEKKEVETRYVEQPRYVQPQYVETQYVAPQYYQPYQTQQVVQQKQIPVWPIVGSDADFKIACKGQECFGNAGYASYGDSGMGDGQMKIVSKIGADLVVENNINTVGWSRGVGTGWSGGPNISNNTQIPVGFDYECVGGVEMPLLNREMMEDDGGTVLAASRSTRKICNAQPDAYTMFAQRAGFVPEKADGEFIYDEISGRYVSESEIANRYTDEEASVAVQNQVRSWIVASGQTLQEVLKSWCDKEGWDLVWSTAREYPIEASAVFKGRFVDVASALVRNFERANPVPYAKFYKGNRVLVITTLDE